MSTKIPFTHFFGTALYDAKPKRKICAECLSTSISWLFKDLVDVCDQCNNTHGGGIHMSGQIAMALVARKLWHDPLGDLRRAQGDSGVGHPMTLSEIFEEHRETLEPLGATGKVPMHPVSVVWREGDDYGTLVRTADLEENQHEPERRPG